MGKFDGFEEVPAPKASKFSGFEEAPPPEPVYPLDMVSSSLKGESAAERRQRRENLFKQDEQYFRNRPGFAQPGGELDTGWLRGQFPLAGGLFGGAIGAGSTAPMGGWGGVVGAGLGSAGGQAIENNLRRSLGLGNAPATIGAELKNLGMAGATGAASEAGGQIISKPIEKAFQFVSTGIQSKKIPVFSDTMIPEFNPGGIPIGKVAGFNKQFTANEARQAFKAQELARKATYKQGVAELSDTFRVQEAARRAAYNAERLASQEAVKTLPDATGAAVRVDAARNLADAIHKADTALSTELGKIVNPIINKSGAAQISVEPVRQEIMAVLRENGLVDDAGNLLKNEVKNILAPQRRGLAETLIRLSDNLATNSTVSGLNRTVKDLQSLANFGAATRSAEDKVFGSLSRAAKESLYDGIQQVAGPKAKNTIAAARKVFSENQSVFEQLRKIADRHPEQIINSARSALPGTFIQTAITKQPALKRPIGDVVLNDLARAFSSPQNFQSAINRYGRDALQQLFPPDTYKAVMSAENALTRSFQPFQPNRAPVPIPFKPGEPPTYQLSPFWQKRLNAVMAGETLAQPVLRSLFQAIGRSASSQQKEIQK